MRLLSVSPVTSVDNLTSDNTETSANCVTSDTFMTYAKTLTCALLLGCCVIADSTDNGFAVRKVTDLRLLALRCRGDQLADDVRSVQYFTLERRPMSSHRDYVVIASLSPVDGVRLENMDDVTGVFVGGALDVNHIQSSTLTLLLPLTDFTADMTYGCRMGFFRKSARSDTMFSAINITHTDLDNLRQEAEVEESITSTQPTKPKITDRGSEHSSTEMASATRVDEEEEWMTTTLLAMVVLFVLLLSTCVVLTLAKCRGNSGNNKRRKPQTAMMACPKAAEDQDDLPPFPPGATPPSYWPRPQSYFTTAVMASRSVHDDTGYVSDASLHYSQPYDVMVDKPAPSDVFMFKTGECLSTQTPLRTQETPGTSAYDKGGYSAKQSI